MKKMVLWLDDIRPMPDAYKGGSFARVWHSYSVQNAQAAIQAAEKAGVKDFLLDLDHDLGDYANKGGDGIKLILWLIETGRNNERYQVKLHTMNSVGKENMQALITRYWR